jgi:hypothetical protein
VLGHAAAAAHTNSRFGWRWWLLLLLDLASRCCWLLHLQLLKLQGLLLLLHLL